MKHVFSDTQVQGNCLGLHTITVKNYTCCQYETLQANIAWNMFDFSAELFQIPGHQLRASAIALLAVSVYGNKFFCMHVCMTLLPV